MQTESVELGFLSIFALITFFIFLIIEKYSYKFDSKALLDTDFEKPQSFHSEPISRSGGIASFISLLIFFWIYFLLYSQILYEYVFISLCLFFVGYLDDIKTNISPNKRLLLMIIFLILIINFFSIQIEKVDLIFLNAWLESNIFSTFFVLLCFLFIINGANLIDGFNGLLTINLIIINTVLSYINLNNANIEFSILLIAQIIILLSFLLFNFPQAKIFLGDGGAYLMGSLTALNTINTNNLNPQISSFFFCSLLFYLFFEVFFSFIRKIYQKKSPIHPDDRHLHMLCYYKISSIYSKNKSNFINSIIINFIYFILLLPGLYFLEYPTFSRYWFFSLLLIYLFIYSRLYHLTKN